jgi:hypothetical protein
MYGRVFLQDLIRTIPTSGLAKVLSAYMKSELSKFPPELSDADEDEDTEENQEQEAAPIVSDDILGDMMVPYLICILTVGWI